MYKEHLNLTPEQESTLALIAKHCGVEIVNRAIQLVDETERSFHRTLSTGLLLILQQSHLSEAGQKSLTALVASSFGKPDLKAIEIAKNRATWDKMRKKVDRILQRKEETELENVSQA